NELDKRRDTSQGSRRRPQVMPTGIKPAGFSGYETPPRRGGSNDGSRLRCWWPSRRKCREQLATALGGQDVSLLLVEGDRLSESIVGPGEVAVRAEHLSEIDKGLRMLRDVVATGHGGDCFAREFHCLFRLAATREHACPGGLPRRRLSVDLLLCLLQFGEGILVPTLCDKHVGNAGSGERDVVRRAHIHRHADRVA